MQAKQGDTVLVHYTGRLFDGTVFDSSRDGEPMKVTIGNGEVIEGFERALVGMKPGSFQIENVPAAMAFGEFRAQMVWVVEREHVLESGVLCVGQAVSVTTRNGKSVPARVVETNGARVKVDANHPLAGKALTFEMELVEIVDGKRRKTETAPAGARDSMIILPRDIIDA